MDKTSIPLDVLANSLAQTREKRRTKSTAKLSVNSKNPTFHILDTTEKFVGKAIIITVAARRKKQLSAAERQAALHKAVETVTDKPPKK